jgi:hypothetical protein
VRVRFFFLSFHHFFHCLDLKREVVARFLQHRYFGFVFTSLDVAPHDAVAADVAR